MKKIQIILFFVSGLILSCKTLVDIEIPLERPLLVVNSAISEDEFIKVNVSLSQHILDPEPYRMVEGALIEIYEEDKLLTILSDSAFGDYISATIKPTRGKNYSIKVSKDGFKTATSSVILPLDTIELLNVTTEIKEVSEVDFTYESINLEFSFNDNSAYKNYYELAVYAKYYKYIYDNNAIAIDSNIVFDKLTISSPDPSLEEFQSNGQSLIFSDALFNGHSHTMTVISDSYYSDEKNFNPTYYVSLNNTSESYYLYNLSSQLQKWTTADPFAQPTTVYTNIENGFGVFGAYNTSVVKVE